MTPVLTLLLTLTAAPPTVGRVVSGKGYTSGHPVTAGQLLRAPRGGPVTEVLTTGGCLLRLAPGAKLKLSAAGKSLRCPTVQVLAGRVRVIAPPGKTAPKGAARYARPTIGVKLRDRAWTFSGIGTLRGGDVTGLCVERGAAKAPLRVAPPKPGLPAPPAATAPAATAPAPNEAKQGQCLWLSANGRSGSTYKEAAAAKDRRLAASAYDFAAPAARVTLDLARELAGLSAAIRSGKGGGSEVEGGGQSMCLETGGEGSAADLGGSSVEVTKPPPPTQLRLHIELVRRSQ